ncbi:unnamed protein product [Leuciscus chuanchicus]
MREVCEYDESWQEKLVACATDGAAVMTGSRSGVVSRLRGDKSYILGVHCKPWLELTFKDAVKSCPQCTKVLDHFLRGYRGLIQHFEQIQSPDSEGVVPVQRSKARNFYQTAKNPDIVMFSCFMLDCLTNLSSLPGPRLRECLENPADTFEGVTLAAARDDLSLDGVNSTKDKLIDTFCSNFRHTDVECLIKHLGPLLASSGADLDLIPDQWTFLKSTSTADCKQGFNLMKQVKNDWRSGLRSDTLSDLLTVQLSSPDIEDFDPDSAIQLWHQASVRARPYLMERGAKKRKTQLEDEKEMSEEEDDDDSEDLSGTLMLCY